MSAPPSEFRMRLPRFRGRLTRPNFGAEVAHEIRKEGTAAGIYAGVQGGSRSVVGGAAGGPECYATGAAARCAAGAAPRVGSTAWRRDRARARPARRDARAGEPAAAARAGGGTPGARVRKKSGGVLREGVALRYAVITRHRGEF